MLPPSQSVVPPDVPAAISILIYRLEPLILGPLGALVASRRSSNPIGWLMLGAAASGALTGFTKAYAEFGLNAAHPLVGAAWAAWALGWVWIGFYACLITIVLVFPTGSPVSARWRGVPWLILAGTLLTALGMALLPGPLPPGPEGLSKLPQVENPVGLHGSPGDLVAMVVPYPLRLILPVLLVVSAASMLLRFWRATGIERQQLKWFGFSVGVAVLTLPTISGWLGSWGTLIGNLVFACVPISIAMAVLRYRLYEIDLIIRRTLIYGALTVGLALVYWGSVILLQQLLRPLTQGSDLAIVGSTLAVAALFQPARQRIQALVDRRFYRHKYDAARTLETFSARLRSEIDLDNLSTELLSASDQTIQPSHASIWLQHVERTR
jgi:hypothetical protein